MIDCTCRAVYQVGKNGKPRKHTLRCIKARRDEALRLIKEARDHAWLKTASLGRIAPRYGSNPLNDAPFPKNEAEVTDFIRRRVDLHHRTWIIAPLEDAIQILMGLLP
jgi:hypothetical protein